MGLFGGRRLRGDRVGSSPAPLVSPRPRCNECLKSVPLRDADCSRAIDLSTVVRFHLYPQGAAIPDAPLGGGERCPEHLAGCPVRCRRGTGGGRAQDRRVRSAGIGADMKGGCEMPFRGPMEEHRPEELRGWLLATAVAGMNVLAALAAQSDETEDLRASFLGVAAVWAEEPSVVPALRVLPCPQRG